MSKSQYLMACGNTFSTSNLKLLFFEKGFFSLTDFCSHLDCFKEVYEDAFSFSTAVKQIMSRFWLNCSFKIIFDVCMSWPFVSVYSTAVKSQNLSFLQQIMIESTDLIYCYVFPYTVLKLLHCIFQCSFNAEYTTNWFVTSTIPLPPKKRDVWVCNYESTVH